MSMHACSFTMADINDDTAENSPFEKRLSGLHGLTSKYAAFMFVEQLLTFFVDLHSDYLEASYSPDKGKEKINKEFLKHVTAKAKGKIFVEKYDFAESQDTKDESTMLEEIITLVNSRCQDKLGVQKGAKQKVSVETTDDQHFYKKLFCLLKSGKKDVSKKQKEYDCRIPTMDKSNAFCQSVYSLEQRVSELEAMLEENEATHQEVVSKYENEGAEFRARIATLETNLGETEAILQDLTTDYCHLKDEIEKRKREAIFREVAQPNRSTSYHIEHQISTEESSARAEQSLANTPTNVIEQELHNNYKLLLLHISQRLLQDQIVKLKNWAASSYSVKPSDDVFEILAELDNKGIISSCNVTVLMDFFEGITRIDLVVIIEHFLAGNYSFLRGVQSIKRENQGARRHSHPRAQQRSLLNDAHLQNQAASGNSIPRTSVEEVLVKEKRDCTHTRRDEQSLQIATDGPREQVIIAGTHKDTAGSNGNKLSKPQREPETRQQRGENRQGNSNLSHEPFTGPWLCDHYKRRCLVKFDCCEKYWPCHRCHNSEGNCGQRRLKSRDIRLIKCVSCQKEQPFQASSQFCSGCGIKFAEYFCATCKHLTGTDDNPYHCDKCGICRIHGDRSFHCDVCGVCLDVQLKDNHKCRAGSAHDECCICLEDAFTGCQILPCSHKVHKECATQMIRSGITRCPICRESFAHKLDRHPPHRKHQGKKK